ncbi:hypothetical protein QWY97_02225 [Vibrio cortegadensis]|uniref:metallophosphoesterase n=1 Tax=Vibrio cortegadensis TaxID=1328770 RepID=UPI0021C2F408|nr:metallophosphoesterase [Vibrio cortegadensis]MDN3696171.1 hypothetical protein [Vibrio cortegadensis]
MALIETKYIATLFSELTQYGLRGNSALWHTLPTQLSATGNSYTAAGLLKWVDDHVAELIEQGASDQSSIDEVYIESLNQGGMSGGLLHIRYWQEVMRPTLEQRCLQLEQGLQFKHENQLENLLFIGDLHAQQDKLHALLDSQGLPEDGNDSDTTLVFIGDLIDNSPDSATDHIAALNLVKSLVDNKQALCLLGNHEFNAVGWYLKDANGKYLRDRSKAGNQKQHAHFLAQIGEDSALHKEWVEWFMALPFYLNCGDIRAIHACWHEESIARLNVYLNADRSLKLEHWPNAFNPDHELYGLIETLLKGPEVSLPNGCSFYDKNGIERHHIRAAWWKDEDCVESYRDLAVVPTGQGDVIPNAKLERSAKLFNRQSLLFPVVVGNYTLAPTPFPECLSEQVVCVDFNAAKGNHPLVGYHAYLPGWDESPNELIDVHGFACAEELNSGKVVAHGITQLLNAMLSTLSAPKADEVFSQTVSEVLLTEWDPIGVYEGFVDEELADEYVNYEAAVVQLAQAGDMSNLAAYLLLVERHIIGMERDKGEYLCAQVAHKLVNAWLCQRPTVKDDFDGLF